MLSILRTIDKKVTAILLSITLIASNISFIYADSYTLEQAKELALKNDEQYKLQDSYIEQSWETYNDTYKKNKSKPKATSGVLNRFKSEILPKSAIQSAYIAMEKTKFNKTYLKRVICNNVENAFIDLIKAQNNYDDAKTALAIKESDYKVGKIKLEQGFITESDVDLLESAYKTASTVVDTANKNLITAKQSLNKYLGRDIYDYDVEVVMQLNDIDVDSIDLETIKTDIMAKKQDIYNVTKQLELAKFVLDLTRDKYEKYARQHEGNKQNLFDLGEELHRAERNYEDANYAIDNINKNLDINLNATIDGMKIMRDSINNFREDIKTTRKINEQNKVRLDAGFIAQIDYEKSQANLKAMENKLNNTIAELNKAYFGLTMYSSTDEEIDAEQMYKAKQEMKKTLGDETIEKENGRDRDK